MDRQLVELSALGFQTVFTLILAAVYYSLWLRQRRPYFVTWSLAWALYAIRLVLIQAFIVRRYDGWLFLHQAVTGMMALLLLLAALQFSRGVRWRARYAWLGLLAVVWAAYAIYGIHSMAIAGMSSVLLLSGVTLWTGVVFWRHRVVSQSRGATLLALTFTLWGLHHLDYPLLRPLGTGVLWGVYADVLFIMATALGTLFLVLSDGRRQLQARTNQLEELTRLLLRAQEDERRRIARELHDEAGQVLTAVKIELDLEGRADASAMVARALDQVRNLSNLLRPTVLDDLGLIPALRGLVEDFARRTRIAAGLEGYEGLPPFAPDLQVVIYRVVQESLTNVARHASANRAWVRLGFEHDVVRVVVEDDGRGLGSAMVPHLGILGMRERVTELGGSLVVESRPGAGVRVEAHLPVKAAA